MKYQNIHIKRFLLGLVLLFSYQVHAQFILKAPETSTENGFITNYRWYVYKTDKAGELDTPELLKESESDNTLEVKIPGVYFAKYDGTVYGKNASNYFVVTYCNSPDDEVILNIAQSVSENANVTWNNGLTANDLSPKVKATKDVTKYTPSITKAGYTKTLPSFTVVCLYEEFELIDDEVFAVVSEGTEIAMLENDLDIPPIGFITIGKPTNGTAVLSQNGTPGDPSDDTITYTSGTNFTGKDEFTYTFSMLNTYGSEVTKTATITINALYASDDSLTVLEDSGAGEANQINVAENDNYVRVDATSDVFKVDEQPSNGTLTELEDGVFEYIPDENYNGNDRFTYTLTDAQGNQVTAMVKIIVTAVNDAPVAVDDSFVVETESVILNVLSNDTDVDGDVLTIDDYTLPEHGIVEQNEDGTFTYTPEPNFTGEDIFTYTITDGNGGVDDAQVFLHVSYDGNEKDDIAVQDIEEIDEDIPAVFDVLANDNLDGIISSTLQVDEPKYGTTTVNDNKIVYTPDPDFVGRDIFEYTINYTDSDGSSQSSSAIVIVTVIPIEDTVEDIVYVDSSVPEVVNIDVLANDTFNENTRVEIIGVNQPLNGEANVNEDNTISYLVDEGATGEDIFNYNLYVYHSDGTFNTERGTITVIIEESVDPAPPAPPSPEEDLEIHQLITPNGDGRNDFFKIDGIENYPNNTVKIFNRWGVQVFKSKGYGQGNNVFSGYSDGAATIGRNNRLPVGTYYYTIEYVKEQQTISTAGYLYINY
ncbi:Ig-like domain-containing protein [Joostella sp. CR20]|uniref:Ig-like domain-containing protein n=1 Tax=Joostella sp. CR20 TaxID=2804312 RepID=UPI00313CB77C